MKELESKSHNNSGNSIDAAMFARFDSEALRRPMHCQLAETAVNNGSPIVSPTATTDGSGSSTPNSNIGRGMIRSSSLKTRRTPPDTPTCKAVRFADAFGLDLATVKHIFNTDCPPIVPAYAKKHLHVAECEDLADQDDSNFVDRGQGPHLRIVKSLHPCFPQPGDNPNFMRRVMDQNVCLERVNVGPLVGVGHADPSTHQLTGTVRVKNLTFHKTVIVRVTYNDWRSYTDIPATYSHSPDSGLSDCFTFQVALPRELPDDQKMQFAVQYKTQYGEEFWDNSFGKNYVLMSMELITHRG